MGEFNRMNKVIIKQIDVSANTITYLYEVKGAWKSVFYQKRSLDIVYSCDLTGLPKSIAVVPMLANLLPMAWVYDAEIEVPVCDADFYNSIEQFKQGYRDMYPMISFNGKLTVKDLQVNVLEAQHGCATFFSGGVDAFNTLTQHLYEKPTLLTLWGADVRLDDCIGWSRVENHLVRTAQDFCVDYVTVRSEFRIFMNEGILTQKVAKSGDSWWHGFQHGIGIISHAAPAMYMLGLKTVYIASSFTALDKVTCASDPTIDNYVKFCGCNVIHDGYEFTRQMKIHNIAQFVKRTEKHISLRVCWESTGGGNCCNCEKCLRTIIGLYAEKENPKDYGFDNYDFKKSKSIIVNQIERAPFAIRYYETIQTVLQKNYSLEEVDKGLIWLYKINISKLCIVPMWKKVWRLVLRGARKVKRTILS